MNAPPPAQAGGTHAEDAALLRFIGSEAERCAARRRLLFGAAPGADADGAPLEHHDYFGAHPHEPDTGCWGLALSGGGIRSATFCLGVLQALAAPSDAAIQGLPARMRARVDKPDRAVGLLGQFDYVSSVSGGGFAAGFLQRLFTRPAGTPLPSASTVYGLLSDPAPPKVKRGVKPTPLAWLRENGRYLAPSGAGDMTYAVGLGIRNWAGIHLLFGVAIMFFATLWALLASVRCEPVQGFLHTWWDVPVVIMASWVIPAAGAYWMARDIGDLMTPGMPRVAPFAALPVVGKLLDRLVNAAMASPLPVGRALIVLAAGFAGIGLGLLRGYASLAAAPIPHDALWRSQDPATIGRNVVFLLGSNSAWTIYAAACGAVLVFTGLWAIVASWIAVRKYVHDYKAYPTTSEPVAVALTKCCFGGMQAIAFWLALTVVLHLSYSVLTVSSPHPLLLSSGGAGLLAATYRILLKLVPLLRGAGSSLGIARGIPRRAVGVLLGALAIALVVFVTVFWTAAAAWLMVPSAHQLASPACTYGPLFLTPCWDTPWDRQNAWVLLILCLAFIAVAGHWPSILNMSSYHYFYSSRLRRAYLGAGNPKRTTVGIGPALNAGAADPIDGDDVDYRAYHANPQAPLHLINITLNQTVDPSEQLVQRDRKGKSFVVLPDIGANIGKGVQVAVDGEYQQVPGKGTRLKIGDWLAVSGAAVSTGMGRQTSIGAAVCVTMANARIGFWWPSNDRDGFFRKHMPTYPYLMSELRAKFHGAHRRYLYLTDGGHFENTATYELLRRVKNRQTSIRFILMCDCGADTDYRYDDLANLVRLARVDFGLEIEVDREAPAMPALSDVFGTPETMGPSDHASLDRRCAVLLNVSLGGQRLARIVMIKPRLIRCASTDLLSYYRNNTAFPQQTTGDQFFDDEQWESYRKLGLECCHTVLALGAPLWEHVLS